MDKNLVFKYNYLKKLKYAFGWLSKVFKWFVKYYKSNHKKIIGA